jgi:putative transposase
MVGEKEFWYEDEMRNGTRSNNKKRWTLKGIRPLYPIRIGYEYLYLYVSINPVLGQMFALFLPDLTGQMFQIFLNEFSKSLGDREIILIVDNGGCHKSAELSIPRNIGFQYLPPYCPELNPVERLFEELRKETSNEVFDNLDQVEQALASTLSKYFNNPQLVSNLTLFPYIRKSLN